MVSGPITSWQIEGGKVETVTEFIFLGSKNTVDCDCSHEIKRCLLLGRKIMTNPDSILKSRDINLLTKVHVVKGMVFPVVMWDVHKEGCQSVVLEKTLKSPLTARWFKQSILKEINPEYSLEGLMLKLKLQQFGHPMPRADSLEKTLMLGKIEARRRRWRQRIIWLNSISDSIDMNLSTLKETIGLFRWH